MAERRAVRAQDGLGALGGSSTSLNRQRAPEACEEAWPLIGGVGVAGTLNEIDWELGEKVPPWRQPLGFAPPEGRTPRAVRTLIVVSGYRPRGPR